MESKNVYHVYSINAQSLGLFLSSFIYFCLIDAFALM